MPELTLGAEVSHIRRRASKLFGCGLGCERAPRGHCRLRRGEVACAFRGSLSLCKALPAPVKRSAQLSGKTMDSMTQLHLPISAASRVRSVSCRFAEAL